MDKILRTLALTSGIALALGGIGASSATAPKSPATNAEKVLDGRREAQILTTYDMNSHLRSFDLSVAVEGSHAVLGGNVRDDIAKDLAEQIAMGVDGITHVDNRIHVDADYQRPERAMNDRSFGDKVEDATITASVKSKLLWNSNTDGLDIHVDTNRGRVTLTGNANSSEEKNLAARIARDTEGVVVLNNEIALADKPETTLRHKSASAQTEHAVSDSWITAKVKSSLMLTRTIDSFDITVSTVGGVVSLNGMVDTTAKRELAVQVAKDVRGVKKVDAVGLTIG